MRESIRNIFFGCLFLLVSHSAIAQQEAGTIAAGSKLAAPKPTFSPSPGTYFSTQLVTLSDALASAAIHYTTNGRTPKASSPLYTQPIPVTSTTTIKAIAVASGYSQSAVSSGKYVIKPQTAMPSFSPPPGNYSTAQSVTLTDATSGAAVHYTTDGSTPTAHSLLYKGVAIQVAQTTTIKAMAVSAHARPSAVAVGLYTISPVSSLDLRVMAQQGIGFGIATQTFLSQFLLGLDVLLNNTARAMGLPADGACGDPSGSLLSNLEGERSSSIRPTVPSNSSSPGYGMIYYDNNCSQPWLGAELSNWMISSAGNSVTVTANETANYYDTNGAALGEMTLDEAVVMTGSLDSQHNVTEISLAANGLGSFVPAGGGSPVQLGLACSFGMYDTMYHGDPVTCDGAIVQDFANLGLSIGVVVPLNILPAVSPGLAWSGTQLVAVSAAGSIFTSSNGTAWTSRSSGTSNNLRAVAWSGSQFVAAGSGGTILTSLDGVTWTSRSSGTTASLASVVWAGTQFAAVGSSGTILTSPDGVNWTLQSSGTTETLEGVTWSGTRFVAVGWFEILTSIDGKTWTSTYSPDNVFFGVTWSGGQFVAVGSVIWTSPDGLDWQASTVTGSPKAFLGVTWSDSEFVAVGWGGAIFTSPDGHVWTSQTSGTTLGLKAVTWTGNRFVAIGYGNVVLTSPDAGNWTIQISAPGYGELVRIVSSGSSVVSGTLGSLKLTAPSGQTLAITGGTPYGGATFDAYAGGLSIFPPTPTGWTVTDETHDLKCEMTVGDNKTRNLTGNITSIGTGETLGTVALDRSGTGTVIFPGGAVVPVKNWLQTD